MRITGARLQLSGGKRTGSFCQAQAVSPAYADKGKIIFPIFQRKKTKFNAFWVSGLQQYDIDD